MNIQFFEEFPSEESLGKARLLDFESLVYIAAKSVEEFLSHERYLQSVNLKVKAAYWPVLPESYWISGFSYPYELDNLVADIKRHKEELRGHGILFDLELPFRNRKLFWKNLFSLRQGKRNIEKLFRACEENGLYVATSEYPFPFFLGQGFLRLLGINYSQKKFKHAQIVTAYTSIFKENSFLKLFERVLKGYFFKKNLSDPGHGMQWGIGIIAKVFGHGLLLTPKDLEEDLSKAQNAQIKTVVIFRLEGLNEEHLSVLKRYV